MKKRVSDYCKNIRIKSGLSVNMFAKLHGVSHPYVLRVESGCCDVPSITKLTTLVNVYGLTEEDLRNLDINQNLIDKLLVTGLMDKTIKSIFESTNERIEKFVNADLKDKGYSFDNINLKNKRNLGSLININFDAHDKSIPIYDGIGINENKHKCYLYLFPNHYGDPTNAQLLTSITNHIDVVISSIKNSNEVAPTEKFEVLFITPSPRVYEKACAIKDNNTDRNPKISVMYLKERMKRS